MANNLGPFGEMGEKYPEFSYNYLWLTCTTHVSPSFEAPEVIFLQKFGRCDSESSVLPDFTLDCIFSKQNFSGELRVPLLVSWKSSSSWVAWVQSLERLTTLSLDHCLGCQPGTWVIISCFSLSSSQWKFRSV